MTPKYILAFTLGLGAFLAPVISAVHAQTAPTQQTTAQPAPKSPVTVAKKVHFSSEGERIFAQNCSRCHNTPEGFSPSISGTVVRHMRVRAGLSEHDAQELLRFFNP